MQNQLVRIVKGTEALKTQNSLEANGFRVTSWTVLDNRQVKLTFVRTAKTKVILKII